MENQEKPSDKPEDNKDVPAKEGDPAKEGEPAKEGDKENVEMNAEENQK